jgi:hypothetical protein
VFAVVLLFAAGTLQHLNFMLRRNILFRKRKSSSSASKACCIAWISVLYCEIDEHRQCRELRYFAAWVAALPVLASAQHHRSISRCHDDDMVFWRAAHAWPADWPLDET